MEVKSFITGTRGVSLPFTDYCSLITTDKTLFRDTFAKAIQFGKKNSWKTFELRGGGDEYCKNLTACSTYYTHTLNLAKDRQEIFAGFRGSTKRNIKKAIKEGVNVILSNSLESVKEFYRLNCMTRKEHGLPPQPYFFFKKIYEHIIFPKKGFVALAYYHKKIIAGAVYFHFGEKAVYKYGASDKTCQKLRANNLVMWEAIKWYAQNSFRQFSFGRTELDHEGLLQFKRGWGVKEETINYYRFDLTKDAFVKKSKIKSSYSFFKKMPIPLLKLTGSLLYRHVG
ncbi:MAG: lipid II:glycine glycyltransferase FemX [Methanosarcinaceae archaeon]